jgi:CheY-like chemotaxis protein
MPGQGEGRVSRGLRILIVEDNPDGRQSLRTLLELLGHEVESAVDGEEGVKIALAWKPDVALVDIGLPRLSGFEVARQVRAALGETIWLAAHTGYGQPEDRRRAQEAGFDFHFVKPMKLEELCRWLTFAADHLADPLSHFSIANHGADEN